MAIMFPDSVPDTAYPGEKWMFKIFRDALPDEFLVWHEPSTLTRKSDFILLSPNYGLLVIEVKDWNPEMIIDLEKFRNDLSQAYQEAISLSIEAAYITKDNIKQILAKASQSANSLSVETGYVTDETKEMIIQKAQRQAQGVASKAKDYTPA